MMIFPKDDFPLFNAHPGISYLDSAATSQKPKVVIDAITDFYATCNAQVYRGIYKLAEEATEQFENVRTEIAQFIGAFPDEVIFTKGTTESINCVAAGWAARNLSAGDEILISELEHHANILPWLRLEKELGIIVKYIPLKDRKTLDYDAFLTVLTSNTKLVSITHTSNVLGTRVDLAYIISQAHAQGARVLVDAAQAVGRDKLDVHALQADFVVFSAHKMLGPTGIGVLYMARPMHEEVAPYQLGGGMVHSVDFHDAQWADPPRRYEAGTPPIAQAIGLGAAIKYLSHQSFDQLRKNQAQLCALLIAGLKKISSIQLLGPLDELAESGHMVSFVSKKVHAHDVAAFLDQATICVRAGNHCAQPLHKRLGIDSSVRASFYGYTSVDDVERLIAELTRLDQLL